ncbi:MAG: PrsW family intramembrane metalloprotease, partial [Comamonadaceae bacterium]|nr:PrsW family intramembrane metalloprotease [Comamonadaceae bacterium]
MVDGVIYAAMVGLGFAFAENVDYYGRALQAGRPGRARPDLHAARHGRPVLAPAVHQPDRPGPGRRASVGAAARWPSRPPAAGFAGAVALHALWNAGASAGLFFFVVYGLVMIPALAVLLAIVAVSLKFEGRVIQAQLAPEAATGLLHGRRARALCSVRGRLHASTTAFRQGGFGGWRTVLSIPFVVVCLTLAAVS